MEQWSGTLLRLSNGPILESRNTAHYVQMKSGEPFTVGGIYRLSKFGEEERLTVSLVTTEANKEMNYVHNKPAHSKTSRMMLVINKEDDEEWLYGNSDEIIGKGLMKPLPDDVLEYHECHPIRSNKKRGLGYIGNVPEIREKYDYSQSGQSSLF